MTASRPKRCGSYHSGHEVHFIQARLSWEKPGQAARAELVGDGWVVVTVDGVETRWWTHDDAHVQRLIEETGGIAVLREHSVLAFERPGSASFVCIAHEPSPCPDPDEDVSELSLVDQLEQRGGFLVPGSALVDEDER